MFIFLLDNLLFDGAVLIICMYVAYTLKTWGRMGLAPRH